MLTVLRIYIGKYPNKRRNYRHTIFVLFVLLLVISPLFSQNYTSSFPTSLSLANRSLYLPGNAEYCYYDSLYTNNWRAGTFASIGFIPENKRAGVEASYAFKRNFFILDYYIQGFSLYNNQKIGLTYNRAFSDACAAGISTSYIFYNPIEGHKGESYIDIALSFSYNLPRWVFGFKASYIIPVFPHSLPIWNKSLSMQLSTAFRISENLCIGATVGKDLRYPIEASAEVSYTIAKHILIFGSCGVYPFRCSLGGGYISKCLDIIVSTSYHPPLGATGQITIGWKYQ